MGSGIGSALLRFTLGAAPLRLNVNLTGPTTRRHASLPETHLESLQVLWAYGTSLPRTRQTNPKSNAGCARSDERTNVHRVKRFFVLFPLAIASESLRGFQAQGEHCMRRVLLGICIFTERDE